MAVVSYPRRGQTHELHAKSLRRLLEPLGERVEHPNDGPVLVATVPLTSGFGASRRRMSTWSAESGCDWSYGNVHDENDQPLNWS